jgi:putative transposase
MLRALLVVARWVASAHDRVFAEVARRRPLSAEIAVLHERVDRLRAENDLLRTRLRRLDPRRRPRYRPWERLRILWHRSRYGLSLETTARTFVVSVQTVVNWTKDVASGSARLVQAKPPLHTLPDLIADLVRRLKREWPHWGTRRIAGMLARLGLRVSRTSVQRILRHGPRRPAVASGASLGRRGPLLAKHPGHLYLIDFTRVGGFLRSFVVGAVIDGFSRKVLAIAVASREPTASFAVRLLREAVARYGVPRWVVTDHGRQFTSASFTRALRQRGIRRRYGAVGRTGSLALIERFWRSMKEEYARGLVLYGSLPSIETSLRTYAAWFNRERPHEGPALRTPEEVHLHRSTRARAVPLPSW